MLDVKLTEHPPPPIQHLTRLLSPQSTVPFLVLSLDIKVSERHRRDDFHIQHCQFLSNAITRTFLEGPPSIFRHFLEVVRRWEESLGNEVVGLRPKVSSTLNCVDIGPKHGVFRGIFN